MSLENSILEARLNPQVSDHLYCLSTKMGTITLLTHYLSLQQASSSRPPQDMPPPRAPRSGHDGAGPSRKRRPTGNH